MSPEDLIHELDGASEAADWCSDLCERQPDADGAAEYRHTRDTVDAVVEALRNDPDLLARLAAAVQVNDGSTTT